MCGIVGLMSSGCFTKEAGKAIKTLLLVDAVRGLDSTGIAAINSYDSTSNVLYKRALPATDFLNLRVTESIFKNIQEFNVFLGHNRSATSGSWGDESAHPVVSDGLTVVHNGTVYDYGELDLPTDIYNGQDTVALAYLLNKVGPKKIIQEVSGGTCLVWWDEATQELCFVRNSDRPMFTRYLDKGKGLAFASERWMLESLARHNFDMGGIKQLPKNTVVKYKQKEGNITKEESAFKVIEKYKYPVNSYKHNGKEMIVRGKGIRIESTVNTNTNNVNIYSDTEDGKVIKLMCVNPSIFDILPKSCWDSCVVTGSAYVAHSAKEVFLYKSDAEIQYKDEATGEYYYVYFDKNLPMLGLVSGSSAEEGTPAQYEDCDLCGKPYPVDDLILLCGGVVCSDCSGELVS